MGMIVIEFAAATPLNNALFRTFFSVLSEEGLQVFCYLMVKIPVTELDGVTTDFNGAPKLV